MSNSTRIASAPTKGKQTRQGILSAAYDLIIRQGYAATSMRQIAERSGLALGGIYNHFSSKEEVFRSILQERHPILQMIPLLYVHSVAGALIEGGEGGVLVVGVAVAIALVVEGDDDVAVK